MAKINKVFGNNHKITITSGVLLAGFIAGSAFGSTITYNGIETDLKALENNLSDLLGIGALDKGLINQSLSDSDIVIDYSKGTAPKFVIGGYSSDGSEVKNNKVTLKQGDIYGPVYGGLSHYIKKTDDKTGVTNVKVDINITESKKTRVANSNIINVVAPKAKIGSLTGGLANINLITGNAKTEGNAQTITKVESKNNSLLANENIVEVGNGVSAGNITGGHASLYIKTGNATSGKATVYSYTYADSYANIADEKTKNTLSTYKNNVTIGNDVNVGNLVGGLVSMHIETGNETVSNFV